MSRSRFLALVCLALACALAWVSWSTRAERGTRSAGAGGTDAALRTETSELATSSEQANSFGSPTSNSATFERDERVAAQASEDELLVIVRRRATGEPVAGATVRWLDYWSVDWGAHSDDVSGEVTMERALAARGSAAHTGPDGSLLISRPRGPTDFFARSGDDWTECGLSTRHSGPLVLELEAPRWVDVRVVDERGELQPGVPVGLATTQLGQQSLHWRSVTDAHGMARCELPRDPTQIDADKRFVACLALPLRELVELELDPRAPPTEVLQLALPPTGVLRVRVLEPDGNPSTRSGRLSLGLGTQALHDLAERGLLPSARSRSSFEMSYRDGELVLPRIGLDLEFWIHDDSRGSDPGPGVHVRGPITARQEVVVELVRGRPPALVSGRALEAETGAPIANAQLQFSLIGPVDDWSQRVRTDAQGVFRAPWHHWLDDRQARTLHLAVARGRDGERRSQVALPPNLPRQDWDLGEVALARVPLLAAGRVVSSDTGTPLAGVRIELASRDDTSEAGRAEETRWATVARSSVTTDARGEFVLRREHPTCPVRLQVYERGFLWETLAFEPGDERLELRMRRGGEVEGRLLLAEGTLPEQLDLELASEQPDGRGPSYSPAFEVDGAFEFVGVAPGSYTLRSPSWRARAARFEIPGIVVEAGKTTSDARLSAIDVREHPFLNIELRVLRPDSDRVHEASVHVLDPLRAAPHSIDETRVVDGLGRLSVPGRTLDLQVRAKGLRTQTIRGVSASLAIQLEPALLAELQLVHDHPADAVFELCFVQEIPEPETPEAAPTQGYALESEWAHCVVTDGRSGRVSLPAPGRWSVHGSCADGGHDRAHHHFDVRPADGTESWSIDVPDRAGVQFFGLELAPRERESGEE